MFLSHRCQRLKRRTCCEAGEKRREGKDGKEDIVSIAFLSRLVQQGLHEKRELEERMLYE